MDNIQQFMNDVCIVISGKRNKCKSHEEHLVYLKAYSRLNRHGFELTRDQAAQMKYDNMQEAIAAFVKQCAEDGIELEITNA